MSPNKRPRTTLRDAPVRYTENPKEYQRWYYQNVTKKVKK